mgnify:FL=1
MCLSLLILAAKTAVAIDCDKADHIYQRAVRSTLSTEKEIVVYRSVLDLCPRHVEAGIALAAVLLSSSDFVKGNIIEKNKLIDEAATHLEKAIEYDNKNSTAYRQLAKIYYSQGRTEKAANCYKRILELYPNDKEAKKALGQLSRPSPEKTDKFRSAEAIMKDYDTSSQQSGPRLMGIANFTAPKHRERFNNITFDEWSYSIKKESEPQLAEIGKALRELQNSGLTFFIEGHTDNRGDKDRNQVLSENRARAMKEYLVKKFNISPERIQTQGFGFNRPLFPNDSKENMGRNRRVEVLFLNENDKNR